MGKKTHCFEVTKIEQDKKACRQFLYTHFAVETIFQLPRVTRNKQVPECGGTVPTQRQAVACHDSLPSKKAFVSRMSLSFFICYCGFICIPCPRYIAVRGAILLIISIISLLSWTNHIGSILHYHMNYGTHEDRTAPQ